MFLSKSDPAAYEEAALLIRRCYRVFDTVALIRYRETNIIF